MRKESGNNDVCVCVCDLSSLASVLSLADQIEKAGESVYLLVNNAGVMVLEREKSVDGFDVNTATNTLGTYALTALLAPALERCKVMRMAMVMVTSKRVLKLMRECRYAPSTQLGPAVLQWMQGSDDNGMILCMWYGLDMFIITWYICLLLLFSVMVAIPGA